MRHARDGSLRRLLDEEWAVPEDVRRHVRDCARCQARLDAMRQLARSAEALLSGPAPQTDAKAALRRQLALHAEERGARAVAPRLRMSGSGRWAAGVAGFAVLLAVVAATPVGGYARNLLLIFEPQHFTAVPVTPSQASAGVGLNALGAVQSSGARGLVAERDLPALEAAAGFTLALPGTLPQGLPAPSYAVLGGSMQTVRFDGAKLAAYAAQHHLTVAPMPKDISGSLLSVTTGPAAVLSFGSPAAQLQQATAVPELVIAKAPLPKVYSTGATVTELENYVLSLPGVSPNLAVEIAAISDPAHTMPIPVPIGKATSAPVTVGTAQGLWVEEADGQAGGVVWTSGGYMYGVAGTLGRSAILTVAAGLH